MGITGELVRSVFSKSQSIPRHGSEKRKWSRSVRWYLCGDSLLAAEFEYSLRSNVATNTSRDVSAADEEESGSEATVEQPLHKQNSTYKLFRQEDAAFIIQAAFRNFMARRRARDTSLQLELETYDVRRTISRRTVLKIQEDWDDSTVSSVISKMRMQNRLEAATRRERALAYAFSQQLRIRSKKHGSGGDQAPNMGWSWLERWMAARQPEMNLFQDTTKPMAVDEKESCGSNDLSSLVEFSFPNPHNNPTRPLPKRTFSRHSSSTSIHFTPKDSKAWHVEEDKEKRKRQKQPGVTKRDHAKNAIGLGA